MKRAERYVIVPMKGKGHGTTASNLLLGEEPEESRPLTTDPMDNVIVEINEEETDKRDSGRDGIRDQE